MTIGDNVKIQNNVSVYDAVTLEDDVFCGPSMVFTNVYNPRSAVTRKDEYRRTLVKQRCHARRQQQPSCAAPRSAATPSWARAPSSIATYPTSPSWWACRPARSGWMSRFGERLELPVTSEQPVEAGLRTPPPTLEMW